MPKQEDEPEKYRRQQAFLEAIKNKPYIAVTRGRLVKHDSEPVEKRVDVNMAVDMLRLACNDAYDTAVLVSSDGDLATAIKAIADLGKHVENAYCKAMSSRHLRQECDKCIELDETLLKRCSLENKRDDLSCFA